jgi:hypothetical protein
MSPLPQRAKLTLGKNDFYEPKLEMMLVAKCNGDKEVKGAEEEDPFTVADYVADSLLYSKNL